MWPIAFGKRADSKGYAICWLEKKNEHVVKGPRFKKGATPKCAFEGVKTIFETRMGGKYEKEMPNQRAQKSNTAFMSRSRGLHTEHLPRQQFKE